MKKLLNRCSFIIIFFLLSCSKETINDNSLDYFGADIIAGEAIKITKFVNDLYTFLPDGYNRLGGNSMVAAATDEAVHSPQNSEAERWGTGNWSSVSLKDDVYARCYTGIRRTFVYTEEIHPIIRDEIMPSAERDVHLGQALFIRAILNFELLKRYGGYPIVKKALQLDDDLSIPRSSYDECVIYITELCNQAEALLPLNYSSVNFGRATKGAAMALKARLLLYAASDLNNLAGLTSKWEAAAEASAAVINLKDGAGKVYELYTAGTGYDAFFTALSGNKEIILSKMAVANNNLERLNGPVSITGGEGGTNPTLDFVNAYEMKTGVPFDWNNPAHAANPFANRDPRFEKSILYNGSLWMNNMVIETFEGGKDKVGSKATRTGFYLRKFLSVGARWNVPTGTTQHSFPLFRFAEVLLNYAEAMNEAYGPDADPRGYGLTARQAIAQIRTRAGLTGNQDLQLTVPNGARPFMREAIRRERRIELAFEEHRHLDVRRWKTAEQVLNRPVHGLKIVKASNGTFTYTQEVVENRIFQPRMYRYPIPQSEISRTGIRQNDEW